MLEEISKDFKSFMRLLNLKENGITDDQIEMLGGILDEYIKFEEAEEEFLSEEDMEI